MCCWCDDVEGVLIGGFCCGDDTVTPIENSSYSNDDEVHIGYCTENDEQKMGLKGLVVECISISGGRTVLGYPGL